MSYIVTFAIAAALGFAAGFLVANHNRKSIDKTSKVIDDLKANLR